MRAQRRQDAPSDHHDRGTLAPDSRVSSCIARAPVPRAQAALAAATVAAVVVVTAAACSAPAPALWDLCQPWLWSSCACAVSGQDAGLVCIVCECGMWQLTFLGGSVDFSSS